MKQRLVLILFAIPLLGISVLGQEFGLSETPSSSPEQILRSQAAHKPVTEPNQTINDRLTLIARADHSKDYLLGPGDIVEVTVIGVPGLEKKEFALDGQGRISLPYVNQVNLRSLATREAEVKIAALFGGSLLQDPQVSVGVRQYNSQHCYILGAVHKPGKYQLMRSTSLLDTLSLAGGLTERADTHIRIHHPGADSGTPTDSAEIDLNDILEKGETQGNVTIESGDVITVPERQDRFYYILGDVQKPGAFLIRNGEKVSLAKALANAGGVLRTASSSKTVVIRPKPGSELPAQIPVDAMAVIKGQVRDLELLEDDVVLVPGSASKTIGKGFMAGLNGFVTSLLLVGIR